MPRRLKALLLICLAVAGQALADPTAHEQRQAQDLPLCDRSFAVLKQCGSDLEHLADECCALLIEFRAQGCSCPGCDETSDEDKAEALNSKGMLWMLELTPLMDACVASQDIAGEASLLPLPVEEESQEDAEAGGAHRAQAAEEVKGAGAKWVDAYDGESREAMLHMDDWAEDEDFAQNEARKLAESNEALEAEGEEGEDNDDDDDEMEEGAQVQMATATFLGGEGGQEVRLAEANSAADEDEDDAVEGGEEEEEAGDNEDLLRAESLSSSEDFPLHQSEDDLYDESDDAIEGWEDERGMAQSVQRAQQEPAGEVVLHRTRTVILDMELNPAATGEAAEVVRQVLDSSMAHGAQEDVAGAGALLRPLSRKVTIDIQVEAQSQQAGASLLERLLSWLPGAAAAQAQDFTATQEAVASALQQQLQEQLAAHSSAAVTAVRSAEARRAQLAQRAERAEQQRGGEGGDLCRCLALRMPPLQQWETPVLRYYYIRARLALCQFTCAHREAISTALTVEVAICLLVVAALLARRGAAAMARSSAAAASGAAGAPAGQFVACAADEEWKQPLLQAQV